MVYSNPGDTIEYSTIDNNDILVTGPNNFSQLATLVSVTPNSNAETLTAVYQDRRPGRDLGNFRNGSLYD